MSDELVNLLSSFAKEEDLKDDVNDTDSLGNQLSSIPVKKEEKEKRVHVKRVYKMSEETRAKISLAARKRSPEFIREMMSKMGKKSCKNMTEERRQQLREEWEFKRCRVGHGGANIQSPESRRKIFRHYKKYQQYTEEEFEAVMKELDKKYVEIDAERRRIREEHEKELAERRRARNEARRLAAPHNN